MADEQAIEGRQYTEEDLKNMTPEQLKALQKRNCIFCQIIEGKVQAKKIYEDEKCTAILDINPANPGHILLLPKEHYTVMPQMHDMDVSYLFMVAKGLSQAALKALKAEGTNIFVANGIAAGQKSPHTMIHIIPRKSNDGVASFGLLRRKADREQLMALQSALLQKVKVAMPENTADAPLYTPEPEQAEELQQPEPEEPAVEKEQQPEQKAEEPIHEEKEKQPEQEPAEPEPEEEKRESSKTASPAAGQQKREAGTDSIKLDDIARVLMRK